MRRIAKPGTGIGVPAFVGLAVGILAGLGWRYTVARNVVDANPPPLPPGVSVYLTRLNYYEYVNGPSWWPTLLLPVIGTLLGIAIGMARMAFGRTTYPLLRSDLVTDAVAAGVAGGLTGLCGAVIAQWSPPAVRAVNASGSPPSDYNEGAGFSDVVGAPPYWEISSTFLWFPLAGAMFGVVVAVLLSIGCRTRHIWAGIDEDASPRSVLALRIDALPWSFVLLSPLIAFVLVQISDAMTVVSVPCDPTYAVAIKDNGQEIKAQNVLIAGSIVMMTFGVVALLVAIRKRRTVGRHWRRRLTLVSLAVVGTLIGFVLLIRLSKFPLEVACM